MRSEGRLRTALLALLFLAPLPFGCIEDWSHWLLVILIGLTFCFFLRAGVPVRGDRRFRIALVLALVFLAWMGIQMLPLPRGIVASLSPSAARLYSIGVPGPDGGGAAGYAHPETASLPEREGDAITWITPRFSSWRSLSLYPYGTYRIFWLNAALVAFLLMGASLFREERHRRRLAYALIGIGVLQALYGSIETLSGHQHILLYEKRFYTDVATGTLINRNHFAGMINMIIPLAAGFLLAGRSEGHRLSAREPLLAAGVIVMGIGVVLSRSRMGLASTVAGLLVLSLLLILMRTLGQETAPGGRRRLLGAVALPAALLAVIALYSIGIDTGPTFGRFQSVASDLGPEAIRPALWKETLPVARDFLWTGAGPGAFVHALNPYLQALPIGDFWLFQHAHNDYLEWIVILGAVGLGLGGAAFLVHAARKPRSIVQAAAMAGLATLLVHSVTDFNLSIPSNGLIACALLILIAPDSSGRDAGGGERRTFPGGRLLLVLALAALVVWPGRSLVAALVYRPHYNRVTDLPVVRSALAIAGVVEPSNDTFPRFRADGEREAALGLSMGDLDVGGDLRKQVFDWRIARLRGLTRAQELYIESLDRNPLNYETHFAVAWVESEIRSLVREAGLAGPGIQGPADAESILAPHRASAALGPTAHANLGRLGVLIWNERDHLGGDSESLALDLMEKAATDWGRTGTDWIVRIVLQTRDSITMSLLDEKLKPPSAAYSGVLEGKTGTGPELERCARALLTLAQLREAEMLFEWHVDGLNVLRDEELTGLRDRLLWLDANAATMAPAGGDGPCGDGRDLGEKLRTGSHRLLAAMDRSASQ